MKNLFCAVALSTACCFSLAAEDAPHVPQDPQQENSEVAEGLLPEDAIMAQIEAIRKNDFNILLRVMPEHEINKLKEQWAALKEYQVPEHLVQQFNERIQAMKDPEALAALKEQVKPLIDSELLQQIPLGFFAAQLALTSRLGELADQPKQQEQIKKAIQLLPKIQNWLLTAGLDSKERALALAEKMAPMVQALPFNNLTEFKELTFEQVVDLAGKSTDMLKQSLAVYDIDIESLLESVKAHSVAVEGKENERVLYIELDVFGLPLAFDMEMVQDEQGLWAPKDNGGMMEYVESVKPFLHMLPAVSPALEGVPERQGKEEQALGEEPPL